MAKSSCGDFFVISRNWLGVFLEIFRKPGVFSEICGLRVNYGKRQGVLYKVAGIFQLGIYFLIENLIDQVHDVWIGQRDSSPSWTEVTRTRGCGGALTAHSARALGLAGAHS
jgi:hypothetical protein